MTGQPYCTENNVFIIWKWMFPFERRMIFSVSAPLTAFWRTGVRRHPHTSSELWCLRLRTHGPPPRFSVWENQAWTYFAYIFHVQTKIGLHSPIGDWQNKSSDTKILRGGTLWSQIRHARALLGPVVLVEYHLCWFPWTEFSFFFAISDF